MVREMMAGIIRVFHIRISIVIVFCGSKGKRRCTLNMSNEEPMIAT